jgi:hypothetical protein
MRLSEAQTAARTRTLQKVAKSRTTYALKKLEDFNEIQSRDIPETGRQPVPPVKHESVVIKAMFIPENCFASHAGCRRNSANYRSRKNPSSPEKPLSAPFRDRARQETGNSRSNDWAEHDPRPGTKVHGHIARDRLVFRIVLFLLSPIGKESNLSDQYEKTTIPVRVGFRCVTRGDIETISPIVNRRKFLSLPTS